MSNLGVYCSSSDVAALVQESRNLTRKSTRRGSNCITFSRGRVGCSRIGCPWLDRPDIEVSCIYMYTVFTRLTKISLPQGQSYIMERIYYNGSFNAVKPRKAYLVNRGKTLSPVFTSLACTQTLFNLSFRSARSTDFEKNLEGLWTGYPSLAKFATSRNKKGWPRFFPVFTVAKINCDETRTNTMWGLRRTICV